MGGDPLDPVIRLILGELEDRCAPAIGVHDLDCRCEYLERERARAWVVDAGRRRKLARPNSGKSPRRTARA